MYKQFFQNKNFLKMSIADAVSRFGDSVDSIAFTWLTYELSRSAAMSALVCALNLLPTAVFQPIVGPIAERCRKKPVMISLDIVRAALVLFTLFLYFRSSAAVDDAGADLCNEFCGSLAQSLWYSIFCVPAGTGGL